MNELHFLELCCFCGHSGQISGETLSKYLDDPPTLANCLSVAGRFKCSKCGAMDPSISDDRERLIFDPAQVVPGQNCDTPIPLLRIQAQPKTKLCQPCALAGNQPPPVPPHPQPPKGKERCAKCGAAAVVQRNSKDGSWFIGCSTYPACRRTEEFRASAPTSDK